MELAKQYVDADTNKTVAIVIKQYFRSWPYSLDG
jgi:hypothetical protein